MNRINFFNYGLEGIKLLRKIELEKARTKAHILKYVSDNFENLDIQSLESIEHSEPEIAELKENVLSYASRIVFETSQHIIYDICVSQNLNLINIIFEAIFDQAIFEAITLITSKQK